MEIVTNRQRLGGDPCPTALVFFYIHKVTFNKNGILSFFLKSLNVLWSQRSNCLNKSSPQPKLLTPSQIKIKFYQEKINV